MNTSNSVSAHLNITDLTTSTSHTIRLTRNHSDHFAMIPVSSCMRPKHGPENLSGLPAPKVEKRQEHQQVCYLFYAPSFMPRELIQCKTITPYLSWYAHQCGVSALKTGEAQSWACISEFATALCFFLEHAPVSEVITLTLFSGLTSSLSWCSCSRDWPWCQPHHK